MRLRAAALAFALLVLPGFGGLDRAFAPDAEPWPRWSAHGGADSVDHAPWSAFLARYLHDRPGPNLVRYGAVAPADRAALDAYVAALQASDVDALSRDAQFAFWANLYNAVTVQVMLDHPDAASIRDIRLGGGLFSSGPWDADLVVVAGQPLSLNDIEHRILRPLWNDPRVHYAVNCAALGCPDLQPRAFEAATLDAQLDAAARSFVNDPRAVRIVGGEVVVSSIYDWFVEDFGGDAAGVLAHLRRYAEPALRDRLTGLTRIDDADYDWARNGAP